MKNKVSGFSLLEMSVVVLISGMIMTAILNLIPVIYKTTKSATDSKKMEIVENAFYAFVAKNKRLPRPANMEDTTSDYNKAEISNSYDFFTGTVYDKVYSSRNFDDTLIFGTNSFIMNKLGMYDIGCVINMNNTDVNNSISSKCVGSPNFSETGEKLVDYRETIESYEYEYNEKSYVCVIECGSYGRLNFYSRLVE